MGFRLRSAPHSFCGECYTAGLRTKVLRDWCGGFGRVDYAPMHRNPCRTRQKPINYSCRYGHPEPMWPNGCRTLETRSRVGPRPSSLAWSGPSPRSAGSLLFCAVHPQFGATANRTVSGKRKEDSVRQLFRRSLILRTRGPETLWRIMALRLVAQGHYLSRYVRSVIVMTRPPRGSSRSPTRCH